jgi:hypothetical protein
VADSGASRTRFRAEAKHHSGLEPRKFSTGQHWTSRMVQWAEAVGPHAVGGAADRTCVVNWPCRYRSNASILKNSLDGQPLPTTADAPSASPPRHDNIRVWAHFE